MPEIITIFGGTGFLGRKLVSELRDKYIINIATRSNPDNVKGFDGPGINIKRIDETTESYKNAIEGSAVVINFSGASIAGKRWNAEYKQIMYDSRIMTTRNIVQAMEKCSQKPSVFLSTSATGYYGNRFDEELFEESGPGNDYLSDMCIDWEKEAFAAEKLKIRTVCIRVGFVLDKNQGGLKEMLAPFRYFLGSILGNGRQYMSWIHAEDLIGIYIHSIYNNSLSGAVNGTSPNPVTNREFSKTLAKVLKRPCLLRAPGFALKIVLGEFAEFLLSGQRVIPQKASEAGYEFKYKFLYEALNEILK